MRRMTLSSASRKLVIKRIPRSSRPNVITRHIPGLGNLLESWLARTSRPAPTLSPRSATLAPSSATPGSLSPAPPGQSLPPSPFPVPPPISPSIRLTLPSTPSHSPPHLIHASHPLTPSSYDPQTRTLPPDVESQTKNTLTTITAALASAGATPSDVVRARYILPDRADFPGIWPLLREYFGPAMPAATMVQAGLMEAGMRVEIEVTAMIGAGEGPPPPT